MHGDVGTHPATGEQLALVRAVAARAPHTPPAAEPLAGVDPVARVVVDVPLAHLDHPFDYAVPASLAESALPGVRVRVRFAGQLVDGYVVARVAQPDEDRPLSPLAKVVSAEPVLTPELLAVARRIADRYAGSLVDVLRLAIPPRHAAAERALPAAAGRPDGSSGGGAQGSSDDGTRGSSDGSTKGSPAAAGASAVRPPPAGDWVAYPAYPSFLRRVAAGEAPAAALRALPGQLPAADWPAALAAAAAAALSAGRGAVVVVPDRKDVDRVDDALKVALGPGRHVRLTAGQGPQARYTAWLKGLRGHVRCVVGTRAAAFAPVHDLGLVAWWDDGDDMLAEPRAPYPHVRQVLRERAAVTRSALLVAGFTRSVPVQQWVESGLVRPVDPTATAVRQSAARVLVAGEDDVSRDGPAARAHLPSLAWRSAKAALALGPVLVQVPRGGYLPSLACQACRTPARCRHCHGPLAVPRAGAAAVCRWCGRPEPRFVCRECDGTELRSRTVGVRRTVEEIGRAFPGVRLLSSSGAEVLDVVAQGSAVVVATPGAEPRAPGGYAATLLLDAWALLERPGLDAGQEALRRWTAAASLTRSASEGGVVVLCGVPSHASLPVVEALVRRDPVWFAARELAERRTLGLPPAATVARLVGTRTAVRQALSVTALPPGVELIGPVPYAADPRPAAAANTRRAHAADQGADAGMHENAADDDAPRVQVVLRVTGQRSAGPGQSGPGLAEGSPPGQDGSAPGPDDRAGYELARALAALRATRSAHKATDQLLVQVDPPDLA